MACGATRTGPSRFDERISPSSDPPTRTRPRTPFSPRSTTPSWPERLPLLTDIIQAKLRTYDAANALEEENAVHEILKEIALYALCRGDSFLYLLFPGSTSTRLLQYRKDAAQ